MQTTKVALHVLIEVLHGAAIRSRGYAATIPFDMIMGSVQPLHRTQELMQSIELAFGVLLSPSTKFSLQMTDIHATSPMLPFGECATNRSASYGPSPCTRLSLAPW